METTALYTVRNNYPMFRMAIESFFEYIPNDHCSEIVVVVDCSNDSETTRFLNYINNKNICGKNIRCFLSGERPTRYAYYNRFGRGKSNNGEEVSMGHGVSINKGLEKVETKYVLILDSDTIMLPRAVNLIPRLIDCFKLDEKIMAVGQSSGAIDGVVISHELGPKVTPDYHSGMPNACLMMSDMDGWKVHKLKGMSNGGWAHSPYIYNIYERGFKTCNFNTFKDGYAIHIGYSTLRITREQENSRTMGFVKDSGGYGRPKGKGDSVESIRDWYAGYYCVILNTSQLVSYLKKEYSSFDFSIRKSVIANIIPKELIK